MDFRSFQSWLGSCLILTAGLTHVANAQGQPIRPLADDYVVVYESPDPLSIYCYTPGIVRLDNDRLVATLDQGGKSGREKHGITNKGRILVSDDRGRIWLPRCSEWEMPLLSAWPSPF